MKIYLSDNSNLQKLPYDIGQLQNMVDLEIRDCPASKSLPWTIRRISDTRGDRGFGYCSDENEQTVKDMEPQFKVPRQKLITGLINFSIFSSHKGADLIE